MTQAKSHTNKLHAVKIKDFGRVVTGKTPPTKNREYYGNKYSFITPTDISDNSIFVDVPGRYLSEEGARKVASSKLPANSVCYTCIASVGKIVITKEESFTNQQINSVVVDPKKADYRYVFYLLKNITPEIKGMVGGTASPIINKSAFENIDIDILNPQAQKGVVDVLFTYDQLIENNTRRIQILEQIAQAIYREWFVSSVNGGKLPKGWKILQVEALVKRVSPGKLYDNKSALEKGNVPILDQGKSGIIGYHDDNPGVEASIENPIIVFANHTCYQRLILFPFSAIQNVLPFYPSEENYRNIFWLHYATKDLIEFNDYKGHWPEFMQKEVVVPPFEIAEKFGEKIKPLIVQIYRLELMNKNLRQARDLLLPKLVGGEIRV